MQMQGTVLMLYPKQEEKLLKLAEQAKVSIDEITRRAIDAYNPEDDISDAELELMLEIAIQSTDQTIKEIEKTRKAVRNTLDSMDKRERSVRYGVS